MMLLENFKQWLILNCDSPSTVDAYYRQVKYFVQKHGEILNQENLNNYLTDIRQNKSTSTFNLATNALIKYAKFVKITVEFPKQKTIDKKIPKFFYKEDLERDVFPYIQGICKRNYEKADVVLRFLFLTGIRRQELLSLKREQMNFKANKLELKNTKGNVDRLVPIEKKLKQQILTYFQKYPETNNAFNITLQELKTIIKKINTELPLDYKLTPHLFRHSSGRFLSIQGLNQKDIKELFGHKDIKTTEQYTDLPFQSIQQKYDAQIKGF